MTGQGSITVAILGDNTVVSRALGQLLQGEGYELRLLGEPEAFRPQELLERVDVLLFMPRLHRERRENFLIAIRSAPKTAHIPILALTAVGEEAPPDSKRMSVVQWPCGMEELTQRIAATLWAVSAEDEPGSASVAGPLKEEGDCAAA